ncbi:MAG TPA: AI-2E family transporter [Solirubrobacteraceae bacterium]|nr:AI-2E family transporter [Solirubrobacteraceae bacterium]
MPSDHVVSVRPRTVFMVAATLLGVVAFVWLVMQAERVLVWAFVSLLLALALNPAVELVMRRGVRRRGGAAAIVYLLVMIFIGGIGALVIPTLVQQIGDFVEAVPGYVRELTAGRGPLGWLERDYHVVERVQDAVSGNGSAEGASSLAGGASAALDVTRSVLTFVAAVVTITFMTLFMLLEGPNWIRSSIELLPERRQARWSAIADDIYRMVGRYVTGNLTISFIAGVVTTIVLLVLGVPFALALGLLVAILDLIPLAGATLAAIVVTLVGFTDSSTSGIVLLIFFVVYQQLENHLLQPLIYGRTVRLSPLAILLSVLIGAEVAGVIGALAAIPLGGTIQILLDHWRDSRRPPGEEPLPPPEPAGKIKDRPRQERAVAQT